MHYLAQSTLVAGKWPGPKVFRDCAGALSIIGQILVLSHVGFLEKLFGSKNGLLTGGSVLAGMAYLALGWAHSLWLVIPAIVLTFTFGLSRLPLFSSYMNKYIHSDKRATVLSGFLNGPNFRHFFIHADRGFGISRLVPAKGFDRFRNLPHRLAVVFPDRGRAPERLANFPCGSGRPALIYST